MWLTMCVRQVHWSIYNSDNESLVRWLPQDGQQIVLKCTQRTWLQCCRFQRDVVVLGPCLASVLGWKMSDWGCPCRVWATRFRRQSGHARQLLLGGNVQRSTQRHKSDSDRARQRGQVVRQLVQVHDPGVYARCNWRLVSWQHCRHSCRERLHGTPMMGADVYRMGRIIDTCGDRYLSPDFNVKSLSVKTQLHYLTREEERLKQLDEFNAILNRKHAVTMKSKPIDVVNSS